MESDYSQIPWPTYCQWTTETVVPGCLTIGAGVGVYSLIRFWEIKMTWFHHLGAIVAALAVGYLPLIVITLENWCIRVVWWFRVGRLTTWKGVWNIVANQTNNYEMLVKSIFTGCMSFGTYTTMGGWPSYLLRNKENGKLWVVIGQAPNNHEEYGIDFLVK